ncbi:MAG: hypothetical protein AAGC67_05405 [Myxococcota bacterium]
MRPPHPSRMPALVAASILWIAPAVSAGPLDGLAPPGVCAEPREALAGTAIPGADAGAAPASALAGVGPLQGFFHPNDVAAAPETTPGLPAPAGIAAAVRYPGACETGASACQSELLAQPSGNPPIVPGGRPGQGTTGYPGGPPGGANPAIVPGVRPGGD